MVLSASYLNVFGFFLIYAMCGTLQAFAQAGTLGFEALMAMYPREDSLFRAFVVTRHAASLRGTALHCSWEVQSRPHARGVEERLSKGSTDPRQLRKASFGGDDAQRHS
eukprot:759690-Amphidinium_carterae.1